MQSNVQRMINAAGAYPQSRVWRPSLPRDRTRSGLCGCPLSCAGRHLPGCPRRWKPTAGNSRAWLWSLEPQAREIREIKVGAVPMRPVDYRNARSQAE